MIFVYKVFKCYLRMILCIALEYFEFAGNVKFPVCMASDDSPNGRVKKQILNSMQPKA